MTTLINEAEVEIFKRGIEKGRKDEREEILKMIEKIYDRKYKNITGITALLFKNDLIDEIKGEKE